MQLLDSSAATSFLCLLRPPLFHAHHQSNCDRRAHNIQQHVPRRRAARRVERLMPFVRARHKNNDRERDGNCACRAIGESAEDAVAGEMHQLAEGDVDEFGKRWKNLTQPAARVRGGKLIVRRHQDHRRPHHDGQPAFEDGHAIRTIPRTPMDPRPIHLTVLQPNLAPLKLEMSEPTITLGRATDCTIPIRDRYLSRRHAEIAFASDQWIVRDCGSVNGTMLNVSKLNGFSVLRPGDRIGLGDSEVIFEPPDDSTQSQSQLIALDSDSHAKALAIKAHDAHLDGNARASIVAALALELIEDRPMNDLFEFILDRVMDTVKPSRAALALLGTDGKSFINVRMRRSGEDESLDHYISRTLLSEVVEERNVVSFVDSASQDEKLARAESIVAQHIRSAVCAPLLVGDAVLGGLSLDFQVNRGVINHDDVRLIAQIARVAAVKLETTRLREEALTRAKLDEELRTAYVIQSRLLPADLPAIDGYAFAGTNKPCRTVSGDYFDVLVRPDGRLYFIIADVSGKGITAALVMASVATAFNISTRTDPTPADLLRELNTTLAPKTAPSKFVTMVAGVLDPKTGTVDFANAGHRSE